MSTLVPKGGTGITSELSVRLHHVAAYHREHGRLPDIIDGREQFWLYRDTPNQDVSARLFGPVQPAEVERTDFNHGWALGGWCDEMGLPNLARMVAATCAPSDEVAAKTRYFYEKICGRTAVVYRGNDKVKEIPAVAYNTVFEMARDTGSKTFIVQTDELDFYQAFRREFFDSVHYEEFPQIRKNTNSYVIAPVGKRVQFAINFTAALRALSQANKLVMLSGNIGLWCALFRGTTEDVWQADGRSQKWRKLK